MNRTTTYRWAAATAAVAAGLAVLTALAAPFSTTRPTDAPALASATTRPAGWASTQPVASSSWGGRSSRDRSSRDRSRDDRAVADAAKAGIAGRRLDQAQADVAGVRRG